MMKPLTTILDNRLVGILDKYDTVNSPGKTLVERIAKQQNAPKVIPVIGMQGVGKSTMINALIGEDILPAEADETTCIPVEVKYGEPHAEVFHVGEGKPFDSVNDKDGLQQYVDNNFNPGNEKNISRIVLYRKSDILKDGLTIVDLPGVGSLTQANQQTTANYLNTCCSAVFVVHTIPTITRTESIFIKSHLMFFGSAIFVQNDWGETAAEIESSTSFNNDVLKNVANEAGYKGDTGIVIVNAYDALSGSLRNDKGLINSSNITSLKSKIKANADAWDSINTGNTVSSIAFAIEKAIKTIDNKISELSMSYEEVKAQKTKDVNDYHAQTDKINQIINAFKGKLNTTETEFCELAKTKINEFTKSIQAEMERKINGGMVDGDDIERAFLDLQESKYPNLCNDLLPILFDIKNELQNSFDEIGEIYLNDSEEGDYTSYNSGTKAKGRGESSAWNIAGGIAGIAGGSWFAGTAAGAAISSALGIATAGVGFIVGIGITALITWIGRRKIENEMARTKAEIIRKMKPTYREINERLVSDFTSRFTEFRDNAITAFNTIITNREKVEADMKRHIDDKPADNGEHTVLESDKNYLQTKLNELSK